MTYETVMSMPVYKRKLWIMKHNNQDSNDNSTTKSGDGVRQISGVSINSYAELEQKRLNGG